MAGIHRLFAMSAIYISNAVDKGQYDKREAEYMEIVGRYNKDELQLFPAMLGHLINEMDRYVATEGPYDVLGKLFHELELHNKYKGQFFTPQHICDFMGAIVLQEDDAIIARDGYISVSEPCCGSGAMILGFARAMHKNNHSHTHQMWVEARDLDLKCVHMCYLQLSLYGIPAVVIHSNSLTLEEFSRWYTPVYILDNWPLKKRLAQMRRLLVPEPEDKRFYFEFEDEPRIIMPSASQLNLFEEVLG